MKLQQIIQTGCNIELCIGVCGVEILVQNQLASSCFQFLPNSKFCPFDQGCVFQCHSQVAPCLLFVDLYLLIFDNDMSQT